MKKVLPASSKYKAVREVLEKKKSLGEIAAKYGVCRQSLYFWVKRFKKSGQRSLSLEAGYKRGTKHHKRIAPRLEKQILDLVVKDPQISLAGLTGKLNSLGYKISKHGVYNALLRHELQTKALRARFSELHPTKTVLASEIAPSFRAKIVEEYLAEKKPIAQICEAWGISRPTFYEWKRRYEEVQSSKFKVKSESALVEALARKYKRGYENHRSVGRKVVEAVLSIVRANPGLSVHKIYAEINKEALRLRSGSTILPTSGSTIGHHGIQNILSREGLSTLAKRLVFAGGFAPEPKVQVAPLYRPEIPVYRFGMVFALFKSLPRALVENPRGGLARLGLTIMPFVVIGLWMRMLIGTSGASPVGLVFSSLSLFFGLFFFIYSLKYYISILMVLKLAQGGANSAVANETNS